MSAFFRRMLRAPSSSPAGPDVVDFACNLCGHENRGVARAQVENREFQSCASCRSSLRMRSLMYWLSVELHGKPLALPEFPADKSISGIGMSDWEGYARSLEEKFSYANTYYHREPRLDITNIPESLVGKHRFLISSDVFEHIPCFGLESAFRNARRLLQDGGAFLFTVPYVKTGPTQEHFPRMHDYRVIETRGKRFLYNRTEDGEEEVFDDLVFHGGEGMTLEMRVFSEPDLLGRLRDAGFSSVRLCPDRVPGFGILWPMDWAVPMVARA